MKKKKKHQVNFYLLNYENLRILLNYRSKELYFRQFIPKIVNYFREQLFIIMCLL